MGDKVDIANEQAGGMPDRHESVRHFSLMNSLLAVVNTRKHDSTESILARYFLSHFDQLGNLNVYEVAEECFTTRSGIRRFCQSIGLNNFSDLKSYVWEWEDHRTLYTSYADHADYGNHLASSITQMTQQVMRSADAETLDGLASLLYEARRIVFLTSDFSSMAIHQFQQSMLYLHKVVDIVTDSSGDTSQLAALGAEDLLVAVSEHGNYAAAVLSALDGSPAVRALITFDAPKDLAARFDYPVRLANSRKADVAGRSVYAHYGVTFFLDLLYNRYLKLYGAS